MRKTMALLLSIILSFSCFVLCTTSFVSATETTATGNLLANKTVADWLGGSGNRALDNAKETTVSRYGGYSFISISAHYQGIRLPFSVQANTKYLLTFSVKSANTWEGISVLDVGSLTFDSDGKNGDAKDATNSTIKAELNSNVYSAAVEGSATLADIDEAVWTDVRIEFTPTADSSTYALYLSWNNTYSNANVIISDVALRAVSSVPTYSKGNGAVKAAPATTFYGDEVTYTATPYQGDSFIGWYIEDNLVSTETTYKGNAFCDVPTAKFTRTNLLAGMIADDWYDDLSAGYTGVDLVVEDATDESLYGGTAIKLTKGSTWRGTHMDLPAMAAGIYKFQISVYHPAGSRLSKLAVIGDATYSVPSNSSDPSGQQIDVIAGWQYLYEEDTTVTEATWTTYTADIKITNDVDYDLYIQCASGCNGMIFSDFSVRPMNYTIDYEKSYEVHFRDTKKWAVGGYTEGNDHSVQVKGYSGFNSCDWATVETTFVNINNQKGYPSVSVSANYQLPHVFLPKLQSNTYYKLSFEYMTTAETNGESPLQAVGIFAPTVENARFDGFVFDGDNGFLAYATPSNAFTSNSGFYEDNVYLDSDCYLTGTTSNVWHKVELKFSSAEFNNLALTFLFSAATPVYFDNFKITDLPSTAYNNAAALRMAGKGTNLQKNGLRIYNKINKSFIEDNNIVEFGGIVQITEKLKGKPLTMETLGNMQPGVAFKDSVPLKIWEDNIEYYIYTIFLSDIPSNYYGEDITMRTYAKNADGEIFYGNEIIISVFDVVWSMDNGFSLNGSSISEYDLLAFQFFAKSTDNYKNYTDWLISEGREGGTLSGIY